MARVRPGVLETRATSRRHTALSRELFPTLERPTKATSAAHSVRREGSVSLSRYSTASRGWGMGSPGSRPTTTHSSICRPSTPPLFLFLGGGAFLEVLQNRQGPAQLS